MRVMSWNVQGLGGPLYRRYKYRLRQEINKCIVGGPLDFLLIQEHHLNTFRISRYGSILPGNWDMFWSPAIGNTEVRGGVCMAISQRWISSIIQKQVVIPGRAQFVIIQEEETTWGLLNIYAPNTATARQQFWKDLLNKLPSLDHWCIAGDFNMLEDPIDRMGGSSITIHGHELTMWEQLVFSLQMLDAWHAPSMVRTNTSLLFSRSDRRVNGTNLARLDRFYLSGKFISATGTVHIMPGTTFSDHAPIILSLSTQKNKEFVNLKIPEELLLDNNFSSQVIDLWSQKDVGQESMTMRVANGLQRISEFFRCKSKERFAMMKEREKRSRASLVSLQRLQERYPHCTWIAEKLGSTKQELAELLEKRAEFQYHRRAANWTQVGDKCTVEFFHAKRPNYNAVSIKQLQHENGTISSDPQVMREIATRYYSNLLSAVSFSDEELVCRSHVWNKLKSRITEDMNVSLQDVLTCHELTEALHALPKNCCPGVDGLTPTFFIKYWDVFKADLCTAFQQILREGRMPSQFTEGLIYLIPKSDGPSLDIKKWRPITLLNTVYKILAKAISIRLSTIMPTVIHPTQTGFIRERSILDNVYTFWESVALATKSNQKLVVLMLDFEKAYDRVDWEFLQGVLIRFGFSKEWIKGISSLYNAAQSRVLLAGDYGPLFYISRSVRQGCPLAPFLFLFFAEAMISFLNAADIGIRGLCTPLSHIEVRDAEFADDTALYLKGDLENLEKTEVAISTFCKASGALVNWNKSFAFWVGDVNPPLWNPHPQFRWIPSGCPVRYLGCTIGVDLSMENQVAPLLLSLRQKLLLWSSAKLSFAGRVIVANQVLLASTWYVLSCWIFSKSCILKIRRLIRNFLWSGKTEGNARSKVKWDVITLPRSKGGLGIIDPVDQSRALLSKLLIRGFTPGKEIWKILLLDRCSDCFPRLGAPWSKDVNWIFRENFRVPAANKWEDRFIRTVFSAWKQVLPGLLRNKPKPNHYIEYIRQRIVWNPLFTTSDGSLLGSRQWLSWGKMAEGPAKTVQTWQRFLSRSWEEQKEILGSMHGGQIMYQQIQEAMSRFPIPPNNSNHRWVGVFSRLEVLLAVKGYSDDKTYRSFEVDEANQLTQSGEMRIDYPYAMEHKIRIIGYADRKWYIDPMIGEIKAHWKLWVLAKIPVFRLEWDPMDYQWTDPFTGNKFNFFQYSVQLGRHVLSDIRDVTPAAFQFWNQQGITPQFLANFWVVLWARKQPHQILHVQWLLVHRALPVGTWLHRMGVESTCARCRLQMETQKHCLWECIESQLIWQRLLRIFANYFSPLVFTWGMVVWTSLVRDVFHYDNESMDHGFCTKFGRVHKVPLLSLQFTGIRKEVQPVWEILSSTTIYHIWKTRCSLIFQQLKTPPAELVSNIWLDIVHTLKGQWDGIIGDSDAKIAQRHEFITIWKPSPFMTANCGTPYWHYQPPKWLFPPPIT